MIQFRSMKFKNMVAVLFGLAASGAASSAASGATFTATSRGGDSWTLSFNEDTITTSTSEAVFCNARQAMIMRADLWMPSMGHGSSPVALFPQASGCTAIRNLNFMMRGDWDVRVWLNNNDSGVFSIEVR